ncbi:MAG TPA: 50S ribosomal protein L21 [Firmicutes bacterium]|jgi:large subunit ribosomal protein L21|nr:50S ribosomal protein L21 [Bacillota bacterium]
MYAVVETGGKQFKLAVGDTIDVEKIAADVDSQVVLDKVLLVADEADMRVGKPYVAGASVVTKVVSQGKGKKITGFKYKAKENVRKRYGHRQPYTRLLVESIQV